MKTLLLSKALRKSHLNKLTLMGFLLSMPNLINAQDLINSQSLDLNVNIVQYSTLGSIEGVYESSYSALAHTPFNSIEFFSGLQQPVLRGPGGDPISGLEVPVSDSLIFIAIFIGIYVVGIYLRKKIHLKQN